MSTENHRFMKPAAIEWLRNKGAINESEAKELFADFDAYKHLCESLRTELQGIGVEQYYALQSKCRELDQECERIGRDKVRIANEKAELVPRLKQAERERDEARQALQRAEGAKQAMFANREEWRESHMRLEQANAALLDRLRLIIKNSTTQGEEALQLAKQTLTKYDTAQPTAIQLRPALQWFAIVMEQTLQANDHKGGWHSCSMQYLYEKLDEEVGELSACLSDEEVIKEASDVANIAMMIADRARKLVTAQGEDKPE